MLYGVSYALRSVLGRRCNDALGRFNVLLTACLPV